MLWLVSHIGTSDGNLLLTLSAALDPVGAWLCVNGAVLLALTLSLPANELTVPVLLLILQSGGNLTDAPGAGAIGVTLSAARMGYLELHRISLPVPLPHPLRHHASHCPTRNRQPTLDATRGGTAAGGRHRAVPAPLRAAGIALMTPKRDGLSPGQFRPFFVFGQLYILLTLIYFQSCSPWYCSSV